MCSAAPRPAPNLDFVALASLCRPSFLSPASSRPVDFVIPRRSSALLADLGHRLLSFPAPLNAPTDHEGSSVISTATYQSSPLRPVAHENLPAPISITAPGKDVLLFPTALSGTPGLRMGRPDDGRSHPSQVIFVGDALLRPAQPALDHCPRHNPALAPLSCRAWPCDRIDCKPNNRPAAHRPIHD